MQFTRRHGVSTSFMAVRAAGEDLPVEQVGECWTGGDWAIDWHANGGWEIYYQAKESSRWQIGSARVEVPCHAAYLIKPGVRHRLLGGMPKGAHFYWVVFGKRGIPLGLKAAACWQRDFLVLRGALDLLLPMQGLVREVSLGGEHQREALGGYLMSLTAGLSRLTSQPPKTEEAVEHPASVRARRLMRERLEHPWRLDELARLSGVSPQHLVDVYRRDHGQTPMRALRDLRLEEAQRQLLSTDKRVTDIAHELGFASSQHLATAYRQRFGHSPRQEKQ